MKVLVVTDYGTPTGGAEIQSLRIRDLLRERGHEALMFSSNARPVDVEIASDVTCLGTQGPARRFLQAANPWAAAGLRRVIRTFRPDVVHLRMFLTQLSPLILRELADTPTLLHVVNYQLICPLNTKLLPDGTPCRYLAGAVCQTTGCVSLAGRARFALQRRMWVAWADSVDMIVANSGWTAARLTADGVRVESSVIYGIPSLGPRPPLAAIPTVAFVGRLFRKKGVHLLLRAIPIVRTVVPELRVRIVGAGPERDALQQLVRELKLEDVVTMHGFVKRDEIPTVLGDAWLQVVPSVYEEPFGVVTIEAMMRGTALIATNSGGPSEVVREGETGFLVPSGDVSALAAAIIRVLSDRGLAERLGANAYAIARQEYTEPLSIERMLALYETTIERFDRNRIPGGETERARARSAMR
ncbi:MAG: glycosyltransferase family 4 protein [Anaerolineae bacterium]|nr:glycosyltransferase family 4 protein [Gemmatimonadaceae bacterium]